MPAPAATRSRWAVSAVFFANGLIMASWVPHVPAVKQRLGIGDGALGFVLLSLAAGALCALSVAGWLVRRFGSRRMTAVAAIALCLVLPLPVLSPNVPLVALSLLLLGGCNGLLDVSMNAQAVTVERLHARPIMSSFHGLFSAGGLAGAGAASVVMWFGTAPVEHVVGAMLTGLILVGGALSWLVPTRSNDADSGPAAPVFVRPRGRLIGLGLLAFAALLAEGAMADWSAVYLHDTLASGAAVAAIGFAAFSLTMAIGRLGGDHLVAAFGPVAVLRSFAALAAVGLTLALLVGRPAAAVVGCALVGLGIANAIPILFSRAGRLDAVDAGTALAAVATTGYCGFLTGPALIGLVAELTTLPLALGLVAACCTGIAAYAGLVTENAALASATAVSPPVADATVSG